MEQLQLLRVFLLCLLALHQCLAMPLGSQCVDESFCTTSLQDYYSQLINLPHRINERSVATWSYVGVKLVPWRAERLQVFILTENSTRENIDLNRVPQIIHEANCHTSHSCSGVDNASNLETIPISLRMPVLKKNPSCFPKTSYSLEFEPINIACICATTRQS